MLSRGTSFKYVPTVPSIISNTIFFQTATASHNLGSAFSERVEDAKDTFEKMVLNSYKETDKVTLYSDKVNLYTEWGGLSFARF